MEELRVLAVPLPTSTVVAALAAVDSVALAQAAPAQPTRGKRARPRPTQVEAEAVAQRPDRLPQLTCLGRVAPGNLPASRGAAWPVPAEVEAAPTPPTLVQAVEAEVADAVAILTRTLGSLREAPTLVAGVVAALVATQPTTVKTAAKAS